MWPLVLFLVLLAVWAWRRGYLREEDKVSPAWLRFSKRQSVTLDLEREADEIPRVRRTVLDGPPTSAHSRVRVQR